MYCRRGSTASPMRIENRASAVAASSIVTCFKRRRAGSIVVSQSSSAFISPRPLYRWYTTPLSPSFFARASRCFSVYAYWISLPFLILYKGGCAMYTNPLSRSGGMYRKNNVSSTVVGWPFHDEKLRLRRVALLAVREFSREVETFQEALPSRELTGLSRGLARLRRKDRLPDADLGDLRSFQEELGEFLVDDGLDDPLDLGVS